MQTTEILMNEHQVILENLTKLESLLINNPDFKNEEITKKLYFYFDFIRDYSDRFHHAKEEEIYFKWIASNAPNLEMGPIACMLKEHDIFRTLCRESRTALDNFIDKHHDADKQLCINKLLEFISNLRQHIDKEDTILYKMAENLNDDLKNGDTIMLQDFLKVNTTMECEITKYL